MDVNKINTGNDIYRLGDVVDLMLELDESTALLVGDTIQVDIIDIFNNSISSVTASILDTNLYIAEYTIPYNLSDLYNINKEDDIDTSFYELIDRWKINGTDLSFQFKVSKSSRSQAVEDNSIISISLSGITDISGNIIDDTTIEFTTNLTPYYGNIDSIKAYKRDELNSISNFDMARDIIDWSNYVDLHMKPDVIYYQAQYDNAVNQYINASVAKYTLIPILNTNAESKELDTFKISRQSGGADFVIKKLDELIDEYEKIIYGGGRDTVYIPALFTKGLNDPNRPNVSRATLMINDSYPWVNTTTSCSIVNIDGQDVEVRGVRGITFRSIFRLPPTSIARLNETSF